MTTKRPTREQREADAMAARLRKLERGEEVHFILPDAQKFADATIAAAAAKGWRLVLRDGGPVEYLDMARPTSPVQVSARQHWVFLTLTSHTTEPKKEER